MLFALFGLGVMEIIMLGLACGLPLIIGAVVVVVVFMVGKNQSERRDPPNQDDGRRE